MCHKIWAGVLGTARDDQLWFPYSVEKNRKRHEVFNQHKAAYIKGGGTNIRDMSAEYADESYQRELGDYSGQEKCCGTLRYLFGDFFPKREFGVSRATLRHRRDGSKRRGPDFRSLPNIGNSGPNHLAKWLRFAPICRKAENHRMSFT